ncbi:Di-copper centre-containing protein [Xylariaceae sp. FL1651]|nr:Di-copper centre-containing protein [Xylariaceae sp. FL1651]
MLFEIQKRVLYFLAVFRIGNVYAQIQPMPVIGMKTGIDQNTGEPPLRMNVNDLAEEGGPMWDLFIRGLDALQNKPEGDELSHFEISGIHGLPFEPYNGVGPVPGGSGGGYCPHQSPQLITWHRVHLALYEQAIGDEIQRLALEYVGSDAPAYQEAAQMFRIPYWDWASDPTLPPSSTQENITVNGPNGSLAIHNPLYNYHWQTYPINTTQFPGYGSMGPVTVRDGANGFDPDVVNGNLLRAADMIKDSVYRTFVSTTYDEMASMAAGGSSFETSHNMIHAYVGGSFNDLDLSAFDSLFILHHCNLDRLAAMWTAAHGNETHQDQPFTSQGLYATAKGEIITADSPIKPFYQADGNTFHTGMTAMTTGAFGYTYAETKQGQKEVITQINKLYGDRVAVADKIAVSRLGREWFVTVQVERADLQLPCSIDVYMGDNLAGRTLLLSMPTEGLAHNELSLRRAISRLDVDQTDTAAIERILKNELRVEVVKGDGNTIDPKGISSLELEIVGEDITPPSSESEFPLYSNRTTLMTISTSYIDGEPVSYLESHRQTAAHAINGRRWRA